MTLLSGDASKLAWVCGDDSVEGIQERFLPAVQELADLYERADFPGHVDRATFAMRSSLWRGKIGVLLGEDEDEVGNAAIEVRTALA